MLPLFFQNVLGFNALQTGYALAPGAIATMISTPIAGRLTNAIDARLEIASGLAMFGVGLVDGRARSERGLLGILGRERFRVSRSVFYSFH